MELKIREARPEEEPFLAELLVRAFRDTYAVKMPEVVMNERREVELRDMASKRSKGKTLVAVTSDAIVGTVFLSRQRAPGSLAWLNSATEMKHLAVVPEWRGKGVSELLVQAVEDLSREWGADSICLHVRRGAIGVQKFYLRQGFQREPAGDFDRLPEVFLEALWKKLSAD